MEVAPVWNDYNMYNDDNKNFCKKHSEAASYLYTDDRILFPNEEGRQMSINTSIASGSK